MNRRGKVQFLGGPSHDLERLEMQSDMDGPGVTSGTQEELQDIAICTLSCPPHFQGVIPFGCVVSVT